MALLILLLGIASIKKMPTDIFPEIDIPVVSVVWQYPGLSPDDSYTPMSEELVATCRVPTYRRFLRQTDLRSVYRWQKRFLQHLQWNCPTRRWILKAADHIYGSEALFSGFPRRGNHFDVNYSQLVTEPITVVRQDDAPIGFIRRRWQPYVFEAEGINRRLYELCVLSEISNALRSGY